MTRYMALPDRTTTLRLGGRIEYHPGWLTPIAADALLAEVETAAFRQEQLSGSWQQPRETAWYLRWYPPSSKYQRYWAAPVPGPRMQEVVDVALTDFQLAVNAVLLNRYRHGNDSVLPHSDDEPTMGGPVILSLSLGATRRFMVRPADCSTSPERLHAQLRHGDLIVMSRDMQDHYVHGVPKTDGKPVGPRVNVTLRHYVGGLQIPPP